MQTGNWRTTATGILLLCTLAMSACGGGGGGSAGGADTPSAGGVAVNLKPQAAIVAKNATQSFVATVSGSSNTAVTWAVDGLESGSVSAGTISVSGNSAVYTAPDSDGPHVLVATSVADLSKSDSTTIVVGGSCAPEPFSAQVLDVKTQYGAKGDGLTDDTSAIQRAVNAMAGKGGTVRVPSGTYLVNAAAGGVLLGSNMTFRLESGAILKAIPTSQGYRILTVTGASNVNIVGGGTLQGERNEHTGSSSGTGVGLSIGNNAHDVVVENLSSRDCWGDGFYINGTNATNVTLCNVVSDNNRRAGISITSVDGLIIRNSIFSNSHGAIGECGLNIEPNGGQAVNDVQILGCTFEDNLGPGLAVGVPCTPNAPGVTIVSNIEIDGNTARNNGTGSLDGGLTGGMEISKCSGTAITNNTCIGNAADGIHLRACGTDTSTGANASIVSGNTVSNNGRAGILEEYCIGNTITSNKGTGNNGYGIHSSHCTNRHISDNEAGLPVTYTN